MEITRKMNKNKEIVQAIIELANEQTTVQELWEKAGQGFSLAHVYYIVRTNKLPFKRKDTTKPFKHLAALQALDTENMSIKQIMTKLNLKTRIDYHLILATLRKNNLKFKHARKSSWDSKLLAIDTSNLTVDEISKQIGMQHAWQTNKLYEILPKLGKTYKSKR